MTYSRCALLGATILSSAALCAGESGSAQDASPTALGRVVLSTGISGVAIDTPQAVTVVSQEDIDRAQATTVGELFSFAPGVQAVGSGRVAGESFNIRGVGKLSSSDESRIITTVDGATKFYEQYRLGSFFSDPALYKRVEILRGPASSTLYGAGALGGVINFETKDASDFLDTTNNALRARLSYGSNSDETASSLIFANRASDNFETLAALSYREAGNYSDADGNEILGSEFDAIAGLLKSRLSFGAGNEQSLTLSYTRWNSDLDDTEYSQTGSLGFGSVDREITDDTLAIRYQNPSSANPFMDLDVVLTYSNTQVEQTDAAYGGPVCASASLFCDTEYGYETTALKVENTSSFTGAGSESFVTAGVQLSRQERTAETPAGGLGFHPEGTDTKLGVYAQGEFILGERLTLVPGVRADFITLDPGDGLAFAQFEETVTSLKLAAHYKLNDSYAIFGSVSRTQRAPTLDEIFSFDSNEPNSPDLTMETAKGAELGLAAQFDGVFVPADALDVKATLFHSDVSDLISRDSTPGTPQYRNVDAAEIYGLEVEAAYESDTSFLRAAYSDVRGEDKDSGETLSSIPARNLVIAAGMRNPRQGLEYGWEATYYDGISYGPGDNYPGYEVHDLFLGWVPQSGAFEGFETQLRVNNLLDEQYRNSLAGDAGEGTSVELTLTRSFEF